MKKTRKLIFLITIICLFTTIGCNRNKKAKQQKPSVTVSKAISKTIPVYYDFVGNTQSIQSVNITARVEGYLTERNFKDGQDVNKGDLLFVIDPRPFEASLDEAKAQLASDKAALNYAVEQVTRNKPLVKKQYITQDQYDQYVTQVDEARAAVKADEAQVVQAELNLSYCYMYAPFDGRIGRRLVDVGNLVGVAGQDNTLATLVKLDPIYVYFSPTERDIAVLTQQYNNDKLRAYVVLPDEKIYPQEGHVDFIDNTVDQTTGTLTMRAVIPNPDDIILPGQFTKIRLFVKEQPNAILVPQKAVQSQQGETIVYKLKSDNTVVNTEVTVGGEYKEYSVITKGLKAGDVVVTEGVQKVKSGIKVDPTFADNSKVSADGSTVSTGDGSSGTDN